MSMGLRLLGLLSSGTLMLVGAVMAAPQEGTEFFEKRIRPVLIEHCYECHSGESGKAKGGLMLDTCENIRAGGDTGPAIIPQDLEGSLLLKAIRHEDPDLEMPPKGPALSPQIVADFETWIKAGAPDPRDIKASTAVEQSSTDLHKGRQFWSYQSPQNHRLPSIRSIAWPRQAMDHFVLAKLEESGLAPSPDAEPRVLLRRLYFDITGLPPLPESTATFIRLWQEVDHREALLKQTVTSLLASPRFGERWGRHWLDVARYAESNGRESNVFFPHAWRYRDYVIDAFNADIPFDQFITEQIAGDLIPATSDAERARLLIATGFLAMGAKGLNEMNPAQFKADLVDEQIDTVTRAFTATSVACARCHDHKSEPFSMEDYYALAGIFRSTKTSYGTWVDSENNNGSSLIHLPSLPGQRIPNKSIPIHQVKELHSKRQQLDAEEKAQEEYIAQAQSEGRDISAEGYKLLSNAIRILWTRGGIDGKLMTVDDAGHALPLCMGVGEGLQQEDAMLFNRGEISQPLRRIKRGFPAVLTLPTPSPAKNQSGRLELAAWLTHSEHPLTARVIVNRIWSHLFGKGLVSTPDNFGYSGDRPSHPELLDHLAQQMMQNQWSIKAMIQEIVLSRTYRQASTFRLDCFEKDPDNRWLWRASKRRLEAEAIRDAMLTVTAELDVSRRPGSLVADLDGQSVSLIGFNNTLPSDLDGSLRRSVYLPVIRDHLPDVLELFDFAEPSLVTGQRDVTNVPLQALYLMNAPWIQERARSLATRASREAPTVDEQIGKAFTIVFNRPPDIQEKAFAQHFFKDLQPAPPEAIQTLALFCQSLLASAEFRYLD